MSEIDDIFASKGKAKASTAPLKDAPTSSKVLSKQDKKKKKKQKTLASADSATDSKAEKAVPESSSSKKRPLAETVVDSSHSLQSPSKRRKGHSKRNDDHSSKSTTASKPGADTETDFKNSRGTSSRRKTEEGWSIYKEGELGIRDQGGGKAVILRMFVLFMVFHQTRRYVHLIAIVVSRHRCAIYPFCTRVFFTAHGSFEALFIVSHGARGQLAAKNNLPMGRFFRVTPNEEMPESILRKTLPPSAAQ